MTDQQKNRGWNLQDWKMTDEVAGVEFAGLENEGLENDGLENDGVKQELTYMLQTKTNFNVYDPLRHVITCRNGS